MSESKRRLLNEIGMVQVGPKWAFRVVELPGKMVVRRVEFDLAGKPLSFSKEPPEVYGQDGDELLAVINALAEALVHPSLVESDFVGLVLQ
jgi:hypothetical protein